MSLRLAGALWRFWAGHGHLSEGRRWLAVALAQGAPERTAARALALSGAGNLAHQQGEYAAARAYHQEALAIRRALG